MFPSQLWYDSYIFFKVFLEKSLPKKTSRTECKGSRVQASEPATSRAAPVDTQGGSCAQAVAVLAPARSVSRSSAGDSTNCGTANCSHTSVLAARATCNLNHLCNFHLSKLKASPRSLAGHQALG